MTTPTENTPAAPSDFIRDVVAEEIFIGRLQQAGNAVRIRQQQGVSAADYRKMTGVNA